MKKNVKFIAMQPDVFVERVLDGTAIHPYNISKGDEFFEKYLKDWEQQFDWHDLLAQEIDGIAEFLETSYMEPEDVSFCRDLDWVPKRLNQAYKTGRAHAGEEFRASVSNTKTHVCRPEEEYNKKLLKLEEEVKYWKDLYEAMRR